MDYLTDTTFLIDLWRERGKPGAALRFVERNGQAVVGLPWIAKGEFLTAMEVFTGYSQIAALRDAAVAACQPLIGPADLWLAACALERKLPLLTRNTDEFSRVKELTVIDYSRPTG